MSAVPPNRYRALMNDSALGRDTLASFARATFDPSKWEPYATKRAGAKHPKGTPGFRHITSGKFITREELPDEYMAHDGKVAHERDVSSVTVPANDARDPSLTHVAGDPINEYYHLVLRGPPMPKQQSDRLARLSLLGMARLHEKEMNPAVRAFLPRAEWFADSPTATGDDFAIRAISEIDDAHHHPAHDWVQDTLWGNYSGPKMSHAMNMRRRIGDAVRLPMSGPAGDKQYAARMAQVLRSVYHGGPSLPIPITPRIRSLARAAYDSSDRDGMKVLSDALEEKDAHPHVLDNLRHPDSAVRGNWVLDHILGKR